MPLTLDNDGAALVPGAAMPKSTRLARVVRPFMLDGAPTQAGDELRLPAHFAAEMVGAGKVVLLAEQAAAPAPVPAAPAAQPAASVPARKSAGARG